MSPAESATRAIEWLQGLLSDLSGLRNATSRDPSFKNWRQNTLTTLQRIWAGDQDRSERFRRIPFSPVDPRADMRAQRESFSRGCQEASRVLSSFIEEIVAVGVPVAIDDARDTDTNGFEDDFPTVDLPSGDLGSAYSSGVPEDTMHPEPESHAGDPTYTPPAVLRVDVPANAPPSSAHPSMPADGRPARKGLGVAAKLRDLLGLGGFGAKPAPPSGSFQAPLAPSLDIVPVGDEVSSPPPRSVPPLTRPGTWPTPGPSEPPEHDMSPPPAPPAPAVEPPATTGGTQPVEPGASVIMSRTTTLRSNIGKVSIESLISPEFRGGPEGTAPEAPPEATEPEASTPTPTNTPPPPQARAAGKGASARRGSKQAPPLSIVPPLSGDPEFNVEPSPTPKAPAPPAPRAAGTSKVVPLPLPPGGRKIQPPAETSAGDAPEEAASANVDAEEFARATEDFMRSSPVLGATGRKLKRTADEPTGELSFSDPDAIAVASMNDELTLLGVPVTRQTETRARLVDLARRIENADLEWNALRKAVWFAMEYPEVARRLMPLLLPWIDRAA